MSNLIATKRVDLLAPYMALDQGKAVQAECECSRPSESRDSDRATNSITC